MNDTGVRRLHIWLPLLFAGVLILGMTLGFRMRESLRGKRDISRVIERNDRLEEIIDFIRVKYVDTVNVNNLYADAVQGIISHLDPHTSYIPGTELNLVNEELEGSFYGIGLEFNIIRDTIQVTSIVEKGPAERAAIQVGDKIIKVNDSVVAGAGITAEGIIKLLRGDKRTQAILYLQSPEAGAPLRRVAVVRDEIPIRSIDASLLLNNHTGYIRINRFAANTHTEFKQALRGLKQYGITSLMIDLRQNPGGYLDQAVAVADELIADNKTLVITRSRQEEVIDKAEIPGLYETGKLVILVDEGSASAAEILAAAVQDNDRGLVVGRRTYGKGLVQEQYELDDGSALRLTVARYYTPSGRSLQRSYEEGRDAYNEDWNQRYQNGELTGKGEPQAADTTPFYTAGHRKVLGGGGVTPDVRVPYDSATFNNTLMNLAYGNETGLVVWEYYQLNRLRINAYTTITDYLRHPEIGDEMLAFLEQQMPEAQRSSFMQIRKNARSVAFLKTQLRARLAALRFRTSGYYALSVPTDPVVMRAKECLNSGAYEGIINR